jgi:orotate phosphoribosyltransferase-like protein
VDTISQVRLAFHVEGWSMKKIARELHVSRNTVRKIVRSNETDFSYERTNQPLPRIGPWQQDTLADDEGLAQTKTSVVQETTILPSGM